MDRMFWGRYGAAMVCGYLLLIAAADSDNLLPPRLLSEHQAGLTMLLCLQLGSFGAGKDDGHIRCHAFGFGAFQILR